MKRGRCLIVLLAAALTLGACGGKKQSVVYTLEQENDGLKMTDTMKLEARGDSVEKMEETISMDMAAFDEDTQKLMVEAYDSLVESYQAVDGVECTGTTTDSVYTIQIAIDTSGDTVAKLAEQGLLQVEGSTDGISLEKTGQSLEAGGYTKNRISEHKRTEKSSDRGGKAPHRRSFFYGILYYVKNIIALRRIRKI